MKKNTLRAAAIALCICLLTVGTGAANALSNYANPGHSGSAASAAALAPQKTAATKTEDGKPFKDETVYVLTAADGSVQNVIVSDWLKNGSAADTLSDTSDLTDVEVVRGDASCTRDGSSILWQADGMDVYYRGSASKEPPIRMTVSYQLDGRSITPEALAGESGHVTIRYSFENTQLQSVTVGGKTQQVHVPYVVVTGLVLDNDVFSNIEVTNGRLINDGGRTAVAGLALPGLQEDLGLSSDSLELPEYVEISADAEDFRLGMTMTVATCEPFTHLDTDKLDPLDADLTDAMTQLTDAMTQLTDGSKQLSNGLAALLTKSEELAQGVKTLNDGAAALKSGASQLDAGIARVQSGAAQLSNGLNTLNANSAQLNSGAAQVFQSLLTAAQSQLQSAGLDVPPMQIANYAQVLNGVIASLDPDAVYQQALQTVTAAVEAQRDTITEKVTEAVRAEVEQKVIQAVRAEVQTKVAEAVRPQVRAKVTQAVEAEVTEKVTQAVRAQVTAQVVQAAAGMDLETWQAAVAAGQVDEATQTAVAAAVQQQMDTEAIQQTVAAQTQAQMNAPETAAAIDANTETQMGSAEVAGIIEQNTDAQMATEEMQALIAQNTDAQMATEEAQAAVSQNVEAQVQKAISDTMAGSEVQSKLSAASDGAKQVIALKTSLDSYNAFYLGLQTYTAGVSQAAAGAAELKQGTESLRAGSTQLAAGADALSNGLSQLNGSMPALHEGVSQLHDGADALSEGLNTFDAEVIGKLTDAVDGDLAGLITRVQALTAAAGMNNSFSGLAEGMNGQTHFLYRTQEIGE